MCMHPLPGHFSLRLLSSLLLCNFSMVFESVLDSVLIVAHLRVCALLASLIHRPHRLGVLVQGRLECPSQCQSGQRQHGEDEEELDPLEAVGDHDRLLLPNQVVVKSVLPCDVFHQLEAHTV